MEAVLIGVGVLLAVAFACLRAPLVVWMASGAALLATAARLTPWPLAVQWGVLGAWAGLSLLLLVRPLRRGLITQGLLALYRRSLPGMTETERIALAAGTVWWEGDLFSGRPDWARLLAQPRPTLTAEEQSFIDNEVNALCKMVNDWEIAHVSHGLPAHVWQTIKDKGFLGMIIPKEFGGKGFSAYAHSEVITRLSTRSSASAVSVMVPNSLGPAELLLHYGTPEQKSHYLPRLAKGLDIPAFALTSPLAGSDAAAIPDRGTVCKGAWQGQEVLGMRVTWDKRYITLGPICTVLGLAFRLYDPDHLLGETEDLGITCALVPFDHPGVQIGRRHLPLNAMFHNGPNWGKDVFMPLDFIIGGPAMAGQGWRMLMECLAAGRSISLPGSNTGLAKLTARSVGAYARVRNQFKTAIGKFEGIEEPLARIAANAYLTDAARVFTAGAIDQGEKPSVVSAIVKYHVTERARQAVNDGMDILGGKGICLGPQNFLGRAYQQVPIGITVEGANILTRSLIIFGQGAIRCHPYVQEEMNAARAGDLARFDAALFAHIGFTASNKIRTLLHGLTGGRFIRVAGVAPETRRYYRQLTRLSAAFAFVADVSMLMLGGQLKRREKLSARLGDILSLLYLSSAVLIRYEREGRQQDDLPLVHWALQDCLFKIQNAFEGVMENFPHRWMGRALRNLVFPLGRPFHPPSDALGHDAAQAMITPGPVRDRLTAGCYIDHGNEDDPVAVLELALDAAFQTETVEARLRGLSKSGKLSGQTLEELITAAKDAKLLTPKDIALLARRDALRAKAIRVDDFPPDLGLGDPHAHVRPVESAPVAPTPVTV